ncbi:MAG TPA: M24 family metallopeptidase, partial [Epsilonproteobacteria bacterium]|nr:M24 family metallopeptidase [Campylobacterota bacterium]
MAIVLRKPDEITKLARAGEIVAKTLDYLQKNITIGMTLKEIDTLGEEYIRSQGAIPSFKGLYGFPASVCTSLNEVIIHGTPNDTKISSGDILG